MGLFFDGGEVWRLRCLRGTVGGKTLQDFVRNGGVNSRKADTYCGGLMSNNNPCVQGGGWRGYIGEDT